MVISQTGAVGDGNVTLQSLTIFNTHEWFGQKPQVYFRCQGESRVDLPDVKEKDQVYGFLGQESWQVFSFCNCDSVFGQRQFRISCSVS